MNIRKISTLILALTFVLTGCGDENEPENAMEQARASIDDITTAITGELKANLINAGAAVEEDFKDGKIPSHSVVRLKDENFTLPIEFDKNKLEDAVVITHDMNVKSDMIVVLKAKTDADIPEVENYAKKIKEEQTKTWENYLPDQFSKVQNNSIKTNGRYVIYVTHDEPEKITGAIDKLFK